MVSHIGLSVGFTNIWPMTSIEKRLWLNLVTSLDPQTVIQTLYLHPAFSFNEVLYTTEMKVNGHEVILSDFFWGK